MAVFDIALNEGYCRVLGERRLDIKPGVRLVGWFCFEPPARIWHRVYLRECRIGAFSYVAPDCELVKAEIGRYCSIGDGVTVLSNHPTDWLTTSPVAYQGLFPAPFRREAYSDTQYPDQYLPVRIGDDVWIGSGVKLKGGITIGDGAVIGAGALVAKDVEPFAIVGGVPAKVIRMRFEGEVIEEIKRTRWTQYDISGISLPFHDPMGALGQIRSMAEAGRISPYVPKWVYIDS